MTLRLEWKKVKRTGFVPEFIVGGLLAAAVPVLNMAVRSALYIGQGGSPVQILMDANWQMMAMLNLLLMLAGACLLYHIEYADNALQRICTLPLRESSLFWGKAVLMLVMCAIALLTEAAGIAFCLHHWFSLSRAVGTALLKSFGYAFLLMLPAALGFLLLASAFRSMWVSLGIGVVCVFTATMLPTDSPVLSLFPFALPFQRLAGTAAGAVRGFLLAGSIEIAVIITIEIIFLNIRRSLR
ncbi:MAG: ABC transporter permease [Roseburia sp.]|nr:ABC transporter permease [Roseburia sp.]